MEQFDPLIQMDMPIYLVGMRDYLPPRSSGVAERVRMIQGLMRQFKDKVPEVSGRVGGERYAIIENDITETSQPAQYSAMVAVQSFSSQPSWSVHYTITSGRYAVFQHRGLPRDLASTVGMIYRDWAPRIPGLFASNVEIIKYPLGYDSTDPNATFDYMLPLF